MIIAVTGPIGAGKSSALTCLHAKLSGLGLSTGGVISLRNPSPEGRGYTLWDVATGVTQPLAVHVDRISPEEENEYVPFFCFRFRKQALREGETAIMESLKSDVLFIDEVGFWELSGGGWSRCLSLLPQRSWAAVLGLREGIGPDVESRFNITLNHIVGVHAGGSEQTAEEVLRLLNL